MRQPVHRLQVPPAVVALVRDLHPELKKKVRAALDEILREPGCGKALRQELKGLHSLRVGRFRIIYRIAGDRQIDIVAIGPRERIYEETLRLVLRSKVKT